MAQTAPSKRTSSLASDRLASSPQSLHEGGRRHPNALRDDLAVDSRETDCATIERQTTGSQLADLFLEVRPRPCLRKTEATKGGKISMVRSEDACGMMVVGQL
jgi:hypothetical protein